MTKRDGPGKDEPQSPDPAAAKRPHATLDLKATEIGSKSDKDTKPAAEPSSSQPGKVGASNPAPPSAAAKEAATASAAAKAGAQPKTESSRAPQGNPSATAQRPSSPPRASSGSGFTRFLSHLTAGVAGGLLTFAGLSSIDRPRTDTADIVALTDATDSLRQRLDEIAASTDTQSKTTAGLSVKLAETETKLARLDEIDQSVGALSDSVAKVTSEQAALGQRLKESTTGQDTARIAKLEDQLATIAAAANTPQDGTVPQLAAITGKISDLESTITNQTDTLRKDMLEEIEKRTGEIRGQSETARSATTRLDRDLAQVKTDTARLGQQVEISKANDDRLSDQIHTLRETAASLSSALDGLKGDLDARFGATARPADVTAAVTPLASRVDTLERDVKTVITGEDNRKANAERIVLALELANLKRLLDTGRPYRTELAAVSEAAGTGIDLTALERFKDDGVPTIADLTTNFRSVANAVMDSASEPSDGSVVDRLLAGAKSIVRIRKVNHDPADQSTEAILGRMDASLRDGRLDDVLSEAKKLPADAARPAEDWISKVEARASVDRAVADIERQLKGSLTGSESNSPNGAVQ